MDLRLVLPSGEVRWRQIRAEHQPDETGALTRVVGLIIDIDERKRQELALVEAREEAQFNAERLQLALDAAGAGVFRIDYQTRTFWASPEFIKVVGRSMTFEEATAYGWPMVHPDDADRVRRMVDETRAARTNNVMESRIITPDGEVKWVETRTVLHHDKNGELLRVLGLTLDVDERKKQELALIEARLEAQTYADRLKMALDAGQAGVFETNFMSRTFWCSPQFAEIIGRPLTFEEAAQRTWPMTHPDDADHVAMAIAQAAEEDNTRGFGVVQSRVILPDGRVRWVDTCAELHRAKDGTLQKVVGLVLNIDERKKQELALMEAQRAAEAATEAKSQFLANMSHEIRTPMNGVLGVLHLLEQEALSAEGRDMLGEAQACGRMLAQLLNDVIDFSKIEAGRLDLSPEALDAAVVVRSVAQLLRPQAEAKGLVLNVESAGEDVWIEADPVRLRQALFNLIGNAVKFTHAGEVSVRLAVKDQGEGQRRLRFEISDTGVGIPEHAQARLFQRFHQADGSTAREFGGSGLGLVITRTLAEMMGGEVGFVSEEGAGSTFWFEVTAPAVARATADLQAEGRSGLAGLSVLVVEDNPTNRLVATKILEGLGAVVETAEDGIYGLEAVARRPYDLILMDIQMPRMDGMEATRRIRGLEGPAASTPIIGLTANALAHQRADYLASGMDGVASKPISPPALLAEIATVLERCEAAETPGAQAVG